jgi:hypothetical protein
LECRNQMEVLINLWTKQTHFLIYLTFR